MKNEIKKNFAKWNDINLWFFIARNNSNSFIISMKENERKKVTEWNSRLNDSFESVCFFRCLPIEIYYVYSGTRSNNQSANEKSNNNNAIYSLDYLTLNESFGFWF